MRSDAELVAAVINGDRNAWNELVERHSQLIFANARAVGASKSLADDVCQLVWMRLITRVETIREPERLRGWLAIVARNTAREQLRRVKPSSGLDDLLDSVESGDAPVDAALLVDDDLRQLDVALEFLSERCRELLTMLFSAEMSYDEISDATDMPIGSIGPTRQRCLDRLRSEFLEISAS